MAMKEARVYPGIWCPWAQVLCYQCHGPVLDGHEQRPVVEYDLMCRPLPRHAPPWVCCDACGRHVSTGREEVDALGSLRDRINGRLGPGTCTLDQTGGMCCATNVALSGGYLLITDHEERPGGFVIGEYRAGHEDEEPPGGYAELPGPETAAAFVERRLGQADGGGEVTFWEFMATKEPCDDLRARFPQEEGLAEGSKGYVYCGNMWIEDASGWPETAPGYGKGKWYLVIEREEYQSDCLGHLEWRLYEAGRVMGLLRRLTSPEMVEAIARAFSRHLYEQLPGAQLREVVRRNREDPRYQGTGACASHDFCDANMVMDQAFREVVGHSIDVNDERGVRIWNAAWEVARAYEFFGAAD